MIALQALAEVLSLQIQLDLQIGNRIIHKPQKMVHK